MIALYSLAPSHTYMHTSTLVILSSHYGYLRQSGNPIGFRRFEEDPYQDAFLLHTSSLREFTATKTGDVDVRTAPGLVLSHPFLALD